MTSDAKIGLLLGLVFIFVIAFIINGLPNLKPQQATRADVPVVVGFPDQQQDMGVTGRTQAEADRNWNTLTGLPESSPAVQTSTEQMPAEQPAPVVAQTPSPEAQVAGGQDIRYETLLPGAEAASPRNDGPTTRIENPMARIESLLNRFVSSQQNATAPAESVDVPTAPEQSATAERQQTLLPRADARPTETVARTVEQPKPSIAAARPAVAAAKPIVGKIYTVGEGESLSTVAKNVYGPEEGNRYVNINRIYEANKGVLKSVHEVIAGQKLIIPPLPKPTVNLNKPSDVLSRELFEKVETIGRKPASQSSTQTQTPAAPTAAAGGEGRWYTVQDGDNLWKIASAQLGAGARYDEIAKLNAGLLQDGEKLKVGMKIRLPLK